MRSRLPRLSRPIHTEQPTNERSIRGRSTHPDKRAGRNRGRRCRQRHDDVRLRYLLTSRVLHRCRRGRKLHPGRARVESLDQRQYSIERSWASDPFEAAHSDGLRHAGLSHTPAVSKRLPDHAGTQVSGPVQHFRTFENDGPIVHAPSEASSPSDRRASSSSERYNAPDDTAESRRYW